MPSRSSTRSSAITTRMATARRSWWARPPGCRRASVPSSASTRWARPSRPGAGDAPGAAVAVVADCRARASPSSRRTSTYGAAWRRSGGRRSSASRRRRSTRRSRRPAGAGRRRRPRISTGHARPLGEPGERGVEPAVAQHGGVDAAHEVAQLAHRALGLVVGAGEQRVGRLGVAGELRRGRGRAPSRCRRAGAARRRAGRARSGAAARRPTRRRRSATPRAS